MVPGAKLYSHPLPQTPAPLSTGSNRTVSPISHLYFSFSLSFSFPSFFFPFSLSLFGTLRCKVIKKEKKKKKTFAETLITIPLFLPLPTDPVLFASSCGDVGANPPSTTATIRSEVTLDLRLTSISEAVEFSKNNNLLGVFLDTYLLVGSLWLNEA
jgi:hypothetical protein